MLVVHGNPVTDFDVIPLSDNVTFLTESSWPVITLPTTVLTTSLVSSVPLTNVTSMWGPKRDPLYIVVPITVLYLVILLTGLVGNVSTCVVIARNKHMHTATNYYLFSLAVSDLLLLVSGLPQEMYYNWSRYPYVFGEAFCVLQGFAAETSANATVLTITAFTVERYVAICHPFQSHTLSKLSRAVRLILVIWLLAMGLAVPQALQFGVVYEHLPDGRVLDDEHTVCAVKRVVIPHSFEVSSLVFFVAPMTLISVLYALIGLQLRRSSVRGGGEGSVRLKTGVGGYSPQHQDEDGRKNFSKNAQIKATKHVVKMLVAVVVAFFICWAPFHAQRLLAVYGAGSHDERPSAAMIIVYHTLTYISGVLYYLSTTVNPVLYHIMSHKFREAFKDTLARYLGRRRARGGRWQCYTVLSGRHSNTSNASNCGTGSLRRYLEADMARLHASRRPIVVSFRRHHSQQQDSTVDSELSGGSTSTGPEVYVSMEELTKNNSRKSIRLKKTRNKLNETYLNVICRHSKPTSTGGRDKTVKQLREKGGACSGFTFSSNSNLPYSLSLDNQTEDFLVPPWYAENESDINLPWLPTDTDTRISKEVSPKKASTENLSSSSNNNNTTSRTFEKPTKYLKVEDIEIFQEQHLKIQRSFKKRQRNSRHRSKTQKETTASSSSIEHHFTNSSQILDVRLEGFRNHTANIIIGVPQLTFSRSSTLPALHTVSQDRQTHFNDTDAQAQRLRHPLFLHTSYDNLNHGQIAREGSKIMLSMQLSERVTRKKCLDPDILSSNIIFKAASYVKTGVASLAEQTQSLSDVNETAVSRMYASANDTTNCGFNNDVHGTESLLVKQTKILRKEDENDTVELPHSQIISVEEEIFKKKAEDCSLSKGKEKQNEIKEEDSSLLHENESLPV